MLATLRRLVACLVLLAFVASFIPLGGAEAWAGLWWTERLQFVPALLGAWNGKAWAWPVLALLLLLTLVFGRVFCSWLCPLGIVQDMANRAARPTAAQRKGKAVRFAPNHPWLRGTMAVLAFGCLAAGNVGFLTWLDPYSIAARGMAAFGNPLLTWVANAAGAELPPPDWERYAPLMMAFVGFFLALPLALAVWRGRLYCNTLCPVGAVLGLLARFAPCTPHIDATVCGRCGACMKQCKAQAIDVKNGRVDATRCVACYDCLGACSRGAMSLLPQKLREQEAPAAAADPLAADPLAACEPLTAAPVDRTRRAVLGVGIASLATAALPELPEPEPSNNPAELGTNSMAAVVPPGAQSSARFVDRCTACGLCIANCPTQVLRPAFFSLGRRGFMKPTLDFSRASCDPNCTTCSHACPEGALLPLSLAEKRRTQIGLVQFRQAYCRVWAEGKRCGRCVTAIACPTGALVAQEMSVPTVINEQCRGCRRCARVCPAGAISMVEVEGRAKRLAVIDRSKCIGCGACASACRPRAITLTNFTAPRLAHPEKCIGCGACEHVCPTEAPKALLVAGRKQHLILPPQA